MKIVITGGGTGGHFYPLISVVENIREISEQEKLIDAQIYYIAPEPYDERALFDNEIIFKKNTAGKRRVYFSVRNFLDIFKIVWGVLTALWQIFIIFPDVVFAKGGYVSFPTLFAARLFRIPVIIHESDSVPGRVNLWASKFARRVAIAFPEALKFFPKEKVALVGNPIRKELLSPTKNGAGEYFGLQDNVPTIFVLGGSQGAERINEVILASLPELLKKYQVIHQTGLNNIKSVEGTAKVILGVEESSRYKVFGYLDSLAMKMAAGLADLVVSRSGSGIFEIANWGIPSILVPIPQSVSRDQHSNAYAYAGTGAAVVVEEKNLSSTLLLSEIDRILSDENIAKEMSEMAKKFSPSDAGEKIAREILKLGLAHES